MSSGPILGAHMSIAGGYWKAIKRGADVGCQCVQIFTKNNNQWKAKAIEDEDVDKFRAELEQQGITHTLSHASYLINLASPKPDLLEKSIAAMTVELQRATRLGVPFVVFHPGSFTTSSEEEGLDSIVKSLDTILEQIPEEGAMPLLENTAGQGSNLGWDFAHLAYIIDNVKQSQRVGVCIDTCHTFAAGYPLTTEDEYESTIDSMDEAFGLDRIKAFHLNDSKKEFGSRRDRHEHIGEGEMGPEPFKRLVNDQRFQEIPMYLETEKGDQDGKDFDEMNLETLRSFITS